MRKIISGGQTGADRAGLIAAKANNLATGGWMPRGFLAHDGYHPEFAEIYDMKETDSPTYPPRTYKNAFESDGTVRFAVDFNTAGERCTLNAIKRAGKPHFDVNILGDITPADLAKWITDNKIEILNVAGNSEKSAPGIQEFVIAFLSETIALLIRL